MNLQLLVSGLLGLIVFATAGLAQPSLEGQLRDHKLDDAALRAVEASLDFLKERLATPEQLAEVMLKNPADYQRLNQNKGRLHDEEHTALQKGVRQQLTRFAERRTDLSPGWVDQHMARQDKRIARTIETLLDSDFDKTYTLAREQAVKTQRTELTTVLYPEAVEIEQLAGPKPAEFLAKRLEEVRRMVQRGHPLVEAYVTRVIADRALFEENRGDLGDRITAGTNDGLAQLWRQLREVEQHNGGGAIELSGLKTTILAAVEQVAKQAVVKSYGVFPAVHAAIDKRAKALEIALFTQFVREQLPPRGDCPALPKERVLRGIPPSFDAVPAEWTAHVQALDSALRSETERFISERYAAGLQDSSLTEQFRDKLSRVLTQEDDLRAAFEAGFRACLERPLREHRAKLAAHELAIRQPSVADLSYEFREPMLTHLYSGEEPPASEFPGMTALRMEETQQAFKDSKRKLVDEGKAAVRRQQALVTEQKRQRHYVDQIAKEQDRSKARRAYWQKAYEEEVRQEWRKVRAEVLLKGEDRRVLHPQKYDRVFPLTSETIAKIITIEWKKPVQKQVVATQSTTSSEPGDGGPGGGQETAREGSQTCDEAIPGVIKHLLALAQRCGVPVGYQEVFQALRTFPQPPLTETGAHLAQEQQRLSQAQPPAPSPAPQDVRAVPPAAAPLTWKVYGGVTAAQYDQATHVTRMNLALQPNRKGGAFTPLGYPVERGSKRRVRVTVPQEMVGIGASAGLTLYGGLPTSPEHNQTFDSTQPPAVPISARTFEMEVVSAKVGNAQTPYLAIGLLAPMPITGTVTTEVLAFR